MSSAFKNNSRSVTRKLNPHAKEFIPQKWIVQEKLVYPQETNDVGIQVSLPLSESEKEEELHQPYFTSQQDILTLEEFSIFYENDQNGLIVCGNGLHVNYGVWWLIIDRPFTLEENPFAVYHALLSCNTGAVSEH